MNYHQLVKVKIVHPWLSVITLNRPEKRNALNLSLIEELCTALEALQQDPQQRAVIVNAEGPIFCSGLDLQEENSSSEHSSEALLRLFKLIYETSLVTIASVQGAVIAGGIGIIAACDLVVAGIKTKFSLPENRRGMVAALVSVLLTRQMNMRALREFLLLGEPIDAYEAKVMGLINKVVPEDRLFNEAHRWAELIVKGAPEATRATKNLLRSLEPTSLKDDLDIAHRVHQEARKSSEAAEGIAAFFEKRNPDWMNP